jgi:hypothetical protein
VTNNKSLMTLVPGLGGSPEDDMIRQRQSNMDMMSTSPGDIQPGPEPIKLFPLFAQKS